jgi:Tfp pilus assembly PilM family ATPase
MSILSSWLASPPLEAAIEIAPDAVSIAVIGGRGTSLEVQGYAVEPLPAGAVAPSLTEPNIGDPAAVSQAISDACRQLGVTPLRAALVIPDLATKVSLVRFEQTPARRDDLEQLLRWQVKKSTPFPMDEACLASAHGARSADGAEFTVVVARRNIIREYEGTCETVGIHTGLVDISTFGLVNLFLDGRTAGAGDWLVVHMRPEYASIVILRRDDVIFFRNRAEGDEEALADVVHQTAMYYQDRLDGRGFSRILLGGKAHTPGAVDLARRNLEDHMGTLVEPIDPTRRIALSDRIEASPELMATLSPLVGMLLRARRERTAA